MARLLRLAFSPHEPLAWLLSKDDSVSYHRVGSSRAAFEIGVQSKKLIKKVRAFAENTTAQDAQVSFLVWT